MAMGLAYVLNPIKGSLTLTLLHSEWPKTQVLAVLSAKGLNPRFFKIFWSASKQNIVLLHLY